MSSKINPITHLPFTLKLRSIAVAGIISITGALLGCQSLPEANDQLDAVLWTQTSIEHEIAYRQVFLSATRQLDTALSTPNWDALPIAPRSLKNLPPAVVVDIDETLLDNTPLNARDIINNQTYSYNRWNKWVNEANAQALPGAVDFLNEVDKRGITIYYLTNREHSQVSATLNNLRRRGFPIYNAEQILAASTPTGHCEAAGYNKTCRRQWVANHARVLMLVGDSFGDFVKAKPHTLEAQREAAAPYIQWLGQRWFILPNPTYGDWYSAPYNDQDSLPASQKRKLKQHALDLQ